MKWINYFSTSQIPFYVYKLNKGDAIIYQLNTNKASSIIILHGLMYLIKTFTNHEKLSIAILKTNHIINAISKVKEKNLYYYKAIAIKETFIINFNEEDLIKNQIYINLLIAIIQSYQQTIYQYEMMSNILMHKYVKNRILQLILLLSEEFGIIKKQQIIIPFIISQKTIGIITGSNRITVNRILCQLQNQMLLSYSPQKYILIKNPLILSQLALKK